MTSLPIYVLTYLSSFWTNTVKVSDAVRVLGVLFTPNLATTVSAKCFFQLCQLRHIRCSLDRESAATLVHTFVTSRIDYGNALLANALRTTTDKLQRVLNAAARVVTGTQKFDWGLTQILHNELHWLNVPQRVIFKLCTIVYKCLHGLAPKYLADLCAPVAEVARRRQLRSASRWLLDFPRFNMSNYGWHAFSFAGPHTWNSLPVQLRT